MPQGHRDHSRARSITAAEAVVSGSCSNSYRTEDAQKAFDIAKELTTPLNINQFPESIKAKYLTEALELNEQCKKEVTELLSTHKDTLERLTEALLKYEILDADQVNKIIAGESLDPEPEDTQPEIA